MSTKINCDECNNAVCLIKQHGLPIWTKKIEPNKIQMKYKAGEFIFKERDRVHGIYFIKQGKVKVISTGKNIQDQIVRLAADGHILGHRGYGGDTYPVSAIALSDTRVCFIDNDSFYNFCINNSQFMMEMTMFYSRELRKAELRIKNIGQMSAREKIAEALLYLKDVFGMDEVNKSLNVYLSSQEIADMAGTTSTQVISELHLFEEGKFIAKQGKETIRLINIQGLKNIVSNYDIKQHVG